MNLKNKIKKLALVYLLFPLTSLAAAATPALLEPLPGVSSANAFDNPVEYIKSGYWYILGLTIALSVLMLVIAGVEYTLTWASDSKKGEAKKRMEDAITGLLIALLSYLLLYTINPDMTTIELPDVQKCDTSQNANASTGSDAPSVGSAGNVGV